MKLNKSEFKFKNIRVFINKQGKKPIIKSLLLNKYKHTLILVFFFSLFLRFINYSNRWGLAYDQARDSIIAHHAVLTHQVPLIGPFSASGPFVFGPYVYWVYILVTALIPSSLILLWVFQTTISVLMPFVMFLIGKEISGRKFGILLAFLTAISTAQIAQSTNLTYSTFVGFVVMFVFLFLVRVIKFQKSLDYFLVALLIGLSINIHFQAMGLFFIFFLILFFGKLTKNNFLLLVLGFTIPFIPIIIFDFINNHYQSKNLISFIFSRGDEVSLQKRWLTYAGVYWPREFAHVIGGYPILGYLLGIGLVMTIGYSIWRRKLSRMIFLVFVFLAINVLMLRYFKGEVYSAFLVYLHPAILILVAWLIVFIKKINLFLGIVLLLLVTIITLMKNFEEIKNATNFTSIYSREYMRDLQIKFPNQKFSVYDYDYKTTSRSVPLVLYLTKNNLINDSGIKIGFVGATSSAELSKYNASTLMGTVGHYYFILDLNKYNSEELKKYGWIRVNPSNIYDSTEKWYLNNQ